MSNRGGNWRSHEWWRQYAQIAPLLLLTATACAAVLQMPSPVRSLQLLTSDQYRYPSPPISQGIGDLKTLEHYEKVPASKVAYIGSGGVYVQLLTGSPYPYPFDDSADAGVDVDAAKKGCAVVRKVRAPFLLNETTPPANKQFCGIYNEIKVPGLRSGFANRLKPQFRK